MNHRKKMDKTAFPKTNDAVTKLRNVLKCQICFELKSRNSVIYYKSCGHFFCTDCNKKEPSCTLCQTGKKELPLSLAKDDIKIAALYDKVLDLKLPGRQEIEEIIKSQTEPLENVHLNPLENADNIYKISGAKKIADKQKVDEPVKKVETNKRKSTENLVNTFSDVESKASDAKLAKNRCLTPLKTNASFIKNSKGSTGKKKLNIRKTNCKGETLLHIAGKKGNLADMRELLDAGADINAKDAAGWTPLHDAVANGKMEVMMFLLENGANVNTPGFENNTALHEAVASGKIDACKVLMSYGADYKAINITGKTPLDMAREINVLHIVDILLHTSASLNASSTSESKHDEVFKLEEGSNIWQCQLGKNEEKMVQKFADEFKCEVVSKYSYLMKGKLTHIIVPNDERITLNFFVLSSVFTGAIVTNYRWIEDCLNEKKILSVDEYLPKDEFYNGFKKCRASKTKGNPGLFNGCHFFFGGAFENYMVKDVKISKDHLKCIVEKNGGSILKRCPDPERTTEFTVPYHADENTSIAKTCYFIIAQAGKWDPKPAYNMPHLKTLPIEWLVVCILNFQLVDPEETKLYMEKFFP